MQSAQAFGAIVTAPQALAIDSKNRLVHARGFGGVGPQRSQPSNKAGLKGTRLEQRQDSPKHIFSGNAVRQGENLQEKLFFGKRPRGNGGRTSGSGQDRHHGDDNDTDKWML